MSSALRCGAPRMYQRHTGRAGMWYRHHFHALDQQLGPFSELGRAYAGAAAALWVTFRQDTIALEEAQQARRLGKGRRPSTSLIVRLEKRQWSSSQTYDSALVRLKTEVTARRNGQGGPSLAEVMGAEPDRQGRV